MPANSSATYTLTFRPLTMSAAEQPHQGSVFFPIPDGTGLLYMLEGRAEQPVQEGKVDIRSVSQSVWWHLKADSPNI